MADDYTPPFRARTRKKWTERETIRFVELYEAEDVLWNVEHNLYKNKFERVQAIKRLIQSFGVDISVQDVNKKINNIRSTYIQERTKVIKSLNSGAEVYEPTLVWYEIADRFLNNIVKCRNTNTSITQKVEPDCEREETCSPDTPSAPSPEAKPQEFLPRKRPNVDRIKKSIQQLRCLRNQVYIESEGRRNKEIDDEFSYFGKNIASQLRQLPLSDALDLQSEILDLVKRKRKSLLEHESSNRSVGYKSEIPEHFMQQVWSHNNSGVRQDPLA